MSLSDRGGCRLSNSGRTPEGVYSIYDDLLSKRFSFCCTNLATNYIHPSRPRSLGDPSLLGLLSTDKGRVTLYGARGPYCSSSCVDVPRESKGRDGGPGTSVG